ncbi:hypothetical protein BCA37_17815 [Mycobacterium sp. djl-10]|nr:hypothetical protein BCA37_17815 [Mycobacterium sp. djl-10]
MDDLTFTHYRDSISDRECLGLVVGDVNAGEPTPAMKLADLDPKSLSQFGIQVAEWFVEQDKIWGGHKSTR